MLPNIWAASTSGKGTFTASRSAASSASGVMPDTSSITPNITVILASTAGNMRTAARPKGAATLARNS